MSTQLISKKVVMVSLLSFVTFNASLFAVSPYPGEGSREILVKAGSVIDDIESATEALESLADSIDDSIGSLCCFPTLISSVPYLITEPGTYLVTQDLHVAGGFFGIEILSDDVVLNLCGKKITGSGTLPSGIRIGSAYKNIVIKNGILRDLTKAIEVDASCERVTIEDIYYDNCFLATKFNSNNTSFLINNCTIINSQGAIIVYPGSTNFALRNVDILDCTELGITFSGTTVNPILDAEIENCSINRSCTDTDSKAPIFLSSCRKVNIFNVRANSNGDLRDNLLKEPLAIIHLYRCSDCLIKNTQANNNQRKGAVIGFLLEESTNNILEDCTAFGNISQPTIILSHRAPSFSEDAVAYGFYLCSNSDKNILRNCIALDNQAVGGDVTYNHRSAGFGLNNSDKNILIDCIANKQQADPSPNRNAYGFDIQSCGWFRLIRCIASDNETDGFLFYDDLEGEVKDCQAIINDGYGFDLSATSTDILFFRNVACYNILGNYNNVTSAPVSSPANARGVDNVNCSLIDEDSVDIIESKLFEMNSEIDEVSSKIELLTVCF